MTLVYTIETSASGKVRAQIRKARDQHIRVLDVGEWRDSEDQAKADAVKLAVKILNRPKGLVNVTQVKAVVSKTCHVSVEAIDSQIRSDFCVTARWIAMMICSEHGLNSFQIGKHFKRDRSAASYALTEARKRATIDRKFSSLLDQCRHEFETMNHN